MRNNDSVTRIRQAVCAISVRITFRTTKTKEAFDVVLYRERGIERPHLGYKSCGF